MKFRKILRNIKKDLQRLEKMLNFMKKRLRIYNKSKRELKNLFQVWKEPKKDGLLERSFRRKSMNI